jgi:hypothetical protein
MKNWSEKELALSLTLLLVGQRHEDCGLTPDWAKVRELLSQKNKLGIMVVLELFIVVFICILSKSHTSTLRAIVLSYPPGVML